MSRDTLEQCYEKLGERKESLLKTPIFVLGPPNFITSEKTPWFYNNLSQFYKRKKKMVSFH